MQLARVKTAGLQSHIFLFKGLQRDPVVGYQFDLDSNPRTAFFCRVRKSSGTLLARGRDKIIRDIEKRIADFTFIPVGEWILLCEDILA